jgi:(p)ppGpp synthase/HD superfamily hydrolase
MVEKIPVQLASKISKQYHGNQVDKAGEPYWKHPKRVAKLVRESPAFQQFSGYDKKVAVSVAYLHDVVEDCGVSAKALQAYGFNEDVVNAVLLLSKNIEFPGAGKIERLLQNPVARAVKIADIADNSNKKRQAKLRSKKPNFNFGKYPQALRVLKLSPIEQEWFESVR